MVKIEIGEMFQLYDPDLSDDVDGGFGDVVLVLMQEFDFQDEWKKYVKVACHAETTNGYVRWLVDRKLVKFPELKSISMDVIDQGD